jgi:hypothetical protein
MKSSQKGFVPIILILIAVIIIGGGAYYYSKHKTAVTEIQVADGTPATEPGIPKEPVQGDSKKPYLTIQNNSYRESYLPGDRMSLIIKVQKPDGTLATPDEGFNVQVSPYNADTGQSVYMRNGEYYGGNATFENGVWTFTPIETLAVGNYYYEVTAYCSDSSKSCVNDESSIDNSYQTTNKYTFEVHAPAQAQLVMIENAGLSASQQMQNGSGKIFGSYKIKIVGPTAIAQSQTFTLSLPPIGGLALRDIILLDETGRVVAGPVAAKRTGVENESQKFTFTNVTYQSGTHIYTIKGTIPSTYTSGMGFQLTTNPATDWKMIFPAEPGVTADLSSSGTIRLTQIYIAY